MRQFHPAGRVLCLAVQDNQPAFKSRQAAPVILDCARRFVRLLAIQELKQMGQAFKTHTFKHGFSLLTM